MPAPSFDALVYLDDEHGLCVMFQDSVAHKVSDERFAAFKKACDGEPVHKVHSPEGLRIEGYRCADPSEPLTCIESLWVLADLSHTHFDVETNVLAPQPQ